MARVKLSQHWTKPFKVSMPSLYLPRYSYYLLLIPGQSFKGKNKIFSLPKFIDDVRTLILNFLPLRDKDLDIDMMIKDIWLKFETLFLNEFRLFENLF